MERIENPSDTSTSVLKHIHKAVLERMPEAVMSGNPMPVGDLNALIYEYGTRQYEAGKNSAMNTPNPETVDLVKRLRDVLKHLNENRTGLCNVLSEIEAANEWLVSHE